MGAEHSAPIREKSQKQQKQAFIKKFVSLPTLHSR